MYIIYLQDRVRELAETLKQDLQMDTRGGSINYVDQVVIALVQLASTNFQRVNGLIFGVSQGTSRKCWIRFVDAIYQRHKTFIRMLNEQEMRETARRNLLRHHLGQFAYGVDGCHAIFQGQPRRITRRQHPQLYWCRKQCYSINVRLLAGHTKIYHVDVGFPGSTHDVRVWNRLLCYITC